jgi:BTB/POZ domain-containing protein 8
LDTKLAKAHEENNRLLPRKTEGPAKVNAVKSGPVSSFVKLSDLDKRPLSNSISSSIIEMVNRESPYRMCNSVTEMSWIESKLVMSTRTSEPMQRTFNKKFNLTAAGGMSKSDIFDENGTEGDCEVVVSESDISSLQSSLGRSGQGDS